MQITSFHRSFGRLGAVALALAGQLAVAVAVTAIPTESAAQSTEIDATPIKDRHIGTSRENANKLPRSEGDQAVVDGWPLYRNERGQTAFNDAMATLRATEGAAPPKQAFKGCLKLDCNLSLPRLQADGWLPPGRLWVSPTEYVLIAHSPRLRDGQSYRRRGSRSMQYFVFHEFHNSSRNTDLYDTVASHKGTVFVPLYMSKAATDATGRQFVTVLQVAPHDVVSIHASNRASAGPGIEIAKNASDALEPLQSLAGILVATIVKSSAPRLEVVNHHGTEGLDMLAAYDNRLEKLRAHSGAPSLTLPYVPASSQRIASATGTLDDVITRRGASPRIPVAERGIVSPKTASPGALPEPRLVGPITLATRPSAARGIAVTK